MPLRSIDKPEWSNYKEFNANSLNISPSIDRIMNIITIKQMKNRIITPANRIWAFFFIFYTIIICYTDCYILIRHLRQRYPAVSSC